MPLRHLLLTALLGLSVAFPATAMQITDARSAAVYILKLHPLINACLQQALASNTLDKIWSNPTCQELMQQDPQLVQAWGYILPAGSSRGMTGIPYSLRQPTIDAYSDYKRLAERISELSR